MILEYGTLYSPDPIELSIGAIRKPTLREISKISFERFSYYETFMKITPETYYTQVLKEQGKSYWDSLSKDQQKNTTIYQIICSDEKLRNIFLDMLSFFFVEEIRFVDGFILTLKEPIQESEEIKPDMLKGIVSDKNFKEVIEIIQQTCCIYEKPKEDETEKYKNDLARKIAEKLKKAREQQEKAKAKQASKDHSLPNIISAVANRHPSLNPVNIWDLTLFQLIDSFNRLQVNAVYEIDQTRVSVWGDEKKTFDPALWYKNNNDET